MEKNELTTRDQLKKYFETGKYPTQSQFSDLIDSLILKEDVMTNKEAAILANRLARIDNAFIYYFTNSIEDLKFSVVVSSQDEEDQIITVKETNNAVVKQFLLGSAPYTIKTKKISGERLQETEYYHLSYQINQSYTIYRMFGNNLDTISEGFEFGELDNIGMPIQISKGYYGKKINVLNTSVKFVNKTEVPIQYRIQAPGWGSIYRTEDTVTDHYDLGDYLNFYYNADLTKVSQSIKCEIYNADNDELLTTGYLYAGQNQNSWNGGQIVEVRNVRIECNYSADEK
jgi:hypothetical protein